METTAFALRALLAIDPKNPLVEPAATDTPIWEPMRASGKGAFPPREAMLRVDDVAEAVLFAATRPEGVRIPLLRIERG